jgi:5-oxoprolinase (ATP-hydrolysing)
VVTPVFIPEYAPGAAFYVAARGHHADIGGITPGSMPPFSTCLDEEGLVFEAERLSSGGRLERERILEKLKSGPYPARDPAQNLADLEAQIAANQLGVRLLGELVGDYGYDTVHRYMGFIRAHASQRVREEIEKIPDGRYSHADQLDDGTPIVVCIDVLGDTLRIDFAKTGAQHSSNLNAPRAVTMAAVIYCVRALVGRDIPLNSGCLDPVTVLIPEGSLLAPGPRAAVAAGNVETSQRIVDVLLGALGRSAASQGTMNNLTFGNSTFGYYETIGGGAGAGPTFDGQSGVQVHMTNTRITDPEVLESRYPVRLIEFSLRRGSGGKGRHVGGDGLVRQYEFLEPVTLSILSERRTTRPFGLAGGEAGMAGVNSSDGKPLPGRISIELPQGAIVRIETPGGGGFGAP